ncbi:MAG TPA: 50S ribosomal protein L11 methyltransferase [Bryobacteraceae bacterium]|nr:50S ribosomal protein L11 methyltransferase [Bryobacteraceae bacterium]
MYSLRLTCKPEEVDLVLADLYEAGTVGVRELDEGDSCILIAGFETNQSRLELLGAFADYSPEWFAEDTTDWQKVSQNAWRVREIGRSFLLAPFWSEEPTPHGRIRLIHNPGLACGTGEHPCTRLALGALEDCVSAGMTVVDVGTGSGILAVGAMRLGAESVIGIDIDCAAVLYARENFALNGLRSALACGSVDALDESSSDVTVANISATVLLTIWDDLLRVTRRPGYLILTGFQSSESRVIEELLPHPTISEEEDWVCLATRLS